MSSLWHDDVWPLHNNSFTTSDLPFNYILNLIWRDFYHHGNCSVNVPMMRPNKSLLRGLEDRGDESAAKTLSSDRVFLALGKTVLCRSRKSSSTQRCISPRRLQGDLPVALSLLREAEGRVLLSGSAGLCFPASEPSLEFIVSKMNNTIFASCSWLHVCRQSRPEVL